MGLVVFQIHCTECNADRMAEHVHGSIPLPNGRPHRGRRLACWNKCRACGHLFEALRCGAQERKKRRKLEKYGQQKLF